MTTDNISLVMGTGLPDPYHNLWGIWEKPDETALRQEQYETAIKKYPNPKTCIALEASIASINNEIASSLEERANATAIAGSGRPQSRKIDGYTKRRDELVGMHNLWQCDANTAKLENQQFLDSSLRQLEATKLIIEKEDSTTKYIVWGMLGIIVLASGFLILKR